MVTPCLLLALWSSGAQASPVDTFGAGAGAISLGGGLALPRDNGVIFTNPAALAALPGAHSFDLGFAPVRTGLEATPPLWWDTNRDGRLTAEDPPLLLPAQDVAVNGIHMGLHRKFMDRLAIGVSMFLPTRQILSLGTIEPSLPTYFMYDSRLRRYDLALGLGLRLPLGLHLGGGLRVIPQCRTMLHGTVDVTVVGAEDGQDAGDLVQEVKLDVHSFNLDLVLDMSPTASLHWELGELAPALDGLALAATWRSATGLPVSAEADLQLNLHGEDVGTLEPIVLPVATQAALALYDHYLPAQLGLGIAWSPGRASLYLDLKKTWWEAMKLNTTELVSAHIDAPMVDVADDVFVADPPPEVSWRNTWSWRVGAELRLPDLETGGAFGAIQTALRAGGGVEPTPLVHQSEDTALLDADRLVFGGGLALGHQDPFQWADAVSWSAFGQLQVLEPGVLSREATGEPLPGQPREIGEDGLTRIPVGGRLWTLGAQLTLVN